MCFGAPFLLWIAEAPRIPAPSPIRATRPLVLVEDRNNERRERFRHALACFRRRPRLQFQAAVGNRIAMLGRRYGLL